VTSLHPAQGLTVWVAQSLSPRLDLYITLGVYHDAEGARARCAADAASINMTVGVWEADAAQDSSDARQAFQSLPGKGDETFWRIEEYEVRR
jgi:hypothetical protein